MKALIVSIALAAALLVASRSAHADPWLNTVPGLQVQVTDSGCGWYGGWICPYGWGVRSNWYYTPGRLIVFATNQWAHHRTHEYCHAHQHEAVLYYLGYEPSQDLREWFNTWEYAVWSYHVGSSPAPYTLSQWNQREDWAEACAYYFTDPGRLWQLSPGRYHAIAGLFGYW